MHQYFVYILTNKKYGTLYIGVTCDLIKRVYEHKNHLVEGFSKRYNVDQLIYYETASDINNAIAREKQLKKWNRQWKIQLIDEFNPGWKDLYSELIR